MIHSVAGCTGDVVGIFGRDGSLRLLAETAPGRSQQHGLVMVRADPGLGLSALLDAHASAMRQAGLRTHRVPVLHPSGRTALSGGVPPEWRAPAVVIIDDLHLADDATLLALHALCEEPPDRPPSVVAGRRRGAAAERFARLDHLALVHDLPPLDDEAVRALLSDAVGGEPPEPLLRLAGGARGNPWLLSRSHAEDRSSAVTAWATGLAGADAGLLRFTALLDDPVPVDELAAVAGAAPVDVLAAIGRLAALGLVEEEAGLVRLRHPLVRQDVAASSAGLRAWVARVLSERSAPPEAIAEQFAHAPLEPRTVSWLVEHADRVTTRATPAVVELLDRAASSLAPGDPNQFPLRAALAEALLWSGQLARARCSATTSLAARPDPATRQRLRSTLALVHLSEMDPTGVAAALEPERQDGRLPGRLAAIEAFGALLGGDLVGLERAVAQAEQSAEQDPRVEVHLLNARAIWLCVSRDLVGAMELLDRATALLDVTVSDPGQRLLAQLLRAVVQDLRHERAALETVEQARPLARRIGTGLLVWLHTIAALSAFNHGLWDQAFDEISTALDLPDQYGLAGPLHGVAAMILLHRGDLPAARLHAGLAEQAACPGVAVFYKQLIAVARALVAEAEGNAQQALEIVRTFADGAIGVQHGHSVAAVGSRLVRIAISAGDHELATRLVEQMRQLVARMRQWSSGESAAARGALLYCQGLVDQDVDMLLSAAEELTAGGSSISAAHAAEDAAKVLARSGRSAEARAAYQEAIAQYTALTATGDVHRADAALRAYGVRRGATGRRRRARHGWNSLTAAEHRVTELIAQGLTNREIAERLIVSVRTVDSHVSRALAKLGYSSRVEIALRFEPRS